MKILFYGALSCGGAEHQMVIVAKQLSEKGFEVLFVTQDKNGFYSEELKNSSVKIIEIPQKTIVSKLKLTIPYCALYLFRLVKKENINVGISFLGENNFANCIVAMLMRGKYKVITGLRNARESLLLSRRELFYTQFERYASVKVCNSDNAKKMYAKHFPRFANQLTTIYNIVNLPQISSSYSIRKNGKVHFIVPASYREVKNPFGLLEALKNMSKNELELFDITWYGETYKGTHSYYVKLKKEIEQQNLQDVFILKDATMDIANRMNEADVVALFSSSEGLPNAICEGMMLGKPIVMTKVSDYNVLVGEKNGYLCNWDNIQSIKDAILKIVMSKDDLFIDMGALSRSKAMHLFSEEGNVIKWINVIKHVVNVNNKQL